MAVETPILPPRYRDPEQIGRGGMGEIYCADDEVLGRRVAIKLLAVRYSDDEPIRARFEREALAAARLSSTPNVVTVYDVGEWNGRPFIVMELLPGGTLEDVLRREGAQEPGRALAWLEQAGRALDAAHASGVVHRDVKPANLFLDDAGDVHVADFGIASAAGLDSHTRTGTVLGTAGYLAPEQALGERAGPASDRYGLAVVAFELLTGSRPFGGDTPAAEASAHVHAPVPRASSRRPGLAAEVDAVLRRGLAKDPAARHASCEELVGDLRRALSHAVRPKRRGEAWRPLAAAGGLAAVVVAIVAAALLTGGEERSERAPPPAAAPGPTGVELNQEGFELMRQGRYEEALPLVENALAKLSGSGRREEAFALYNVSATLLELGRCEGRIPGMLDRSEEIQGDRKEIDEARELYEEICGG